MISETGAALDAAVRAHAGPAIGDGEVIVAWLVVAATRTADDGGATITLGSGEGMVRWQVKGMLTDALDLVRRMDLDDDPDRE